MRIAILGCGEIGVLCAKQLQALGHHVTGVRRTPQALPEWLDRKFADVTDPDTLGFLAEDPFDVVIYQVAATGFNEDAYRQAYVDGVKNVAHQIGLVDQVSGPLTSLFFVSSTGVYHQNDDGWVDETSATEPKRFNGQLVLEGETCVRSLPRGVVVRFSGIYGPGRTRLIDRVKANGPEVADDGYTNRIHVEDCAGVLAHLCDLSGQSNLPATGQGSAEDTAARLHDLYLASDSTPALRSEVFAYLAELLRIPHGDGVENVVPETAPGSSAKRIAGSKRCSNQRLLDTGYRFVYPGYREGYRAVIEAL